MNAALYGIDETGWLRDFEHVPSPNFGPRPASSEPRLIVVHGISLPPGQYGGGYVEQFFCNRLDPALHAYFQEIAPLQVSAHCLIERGGRLLQFVSFNDRAWHAGVSSWRGDDNCNDFSIGIELEGCDSEAYAEPQYQRLAELVISLRTQYPAIARDALCGHSDIAPGRKTDPGPFFDWPKLNRMIDKAA